MQQPKPRQPPVRRRLTRHTLTRANSDISIDTLDPALAYDTASDGLIANIYETLVFYDGIATDKFVPKLAEVLGNL